jgi:hypothetical protein
MPIRLGAWPKSGISEKDGTFGLNRKFSDTVFRSKYQFAKELAILLKVAPGSVPKPWSLSSADQGVS